ncbi:MAG: DUF6471 domain-containing protein [Gammaproteobacteria bacterium]|nr:DUF6471 domain-containing protein [Gammaproteobacteria bacterium]
MKFFDSPEMRETLHRLLRSQMALKGIDYNGLSQRLAMMGVSQTATNLRSKINHGTLGAQLFIFIQFALGIDKLDTDGIRDIYRDVERDLDASATVEPSHPDKVSMDEPPSPEMSRVDH